MLITLIILVLSAAFFVAGKVRSDIVALCALMGLLICQILTPEEALSGFSNSDVYKRQYQNNVAKCCPKQHNANYLEF